MAIDGDGVVDFWDGIDIYVRGHIYVYRVDSGAER